MSERDELERELAVHFGAERDGDRAGAPGFAAIRGRRRSERPLGIVTPVLVAGAIVLLALGARALRSPRGVPAGIDLEAVEWTSPTDFLLEIAGTEFLEQVPAIGPSAGWPSIELPSPGASPTEMRRNEL